ncbi:MAG: hypothetical protein IJT95_02740 [Abditibacteriota bacterium]|nr:hypothetical protein [Abditibacteriota bacterium]
MRQKIGLLWLLPVLFALLLPAAAGAAVITTVDELLALGGTTINEDVSLDGVFDLTGRDWTPITEVAEGVTIEGSGSTIIGLDISAANGDGSCSGFVAANKGTITGLTFILNQDASVNAMYAGVVAGRNEADAFISDVKVYGDPGSGDFTLQKSGNSGLFGGIAGLNDGYISECLVSGLTFTDNAGAAIGGIAGQNQYIIESCFADSLNIIGAHISGAGGGIAGVSVGNPETGQEGMLVGNNVTFVSLTGKGLFKGGLAGRITFGSVYSNRVNYADITHEDSGGNACYLGGIVGAVEDLPEDCRSNLVFNYYADKVSLGIVWESQDHAGGIVGGYSTPFGYTLFTNCFYCTDYCFAPMAGVNEGSEYAYTFDCCDAVPKQTMTAPGWAEENLMSPWQNTGPEGYPVMDNRISVSFSRLHRGNSYVPLPAGRLLWQDQDVATIGMVSADTVFDPADFIISCDGDLPLELSYVTLNGQKLTEPVTAGDYDRLNFSAVVDNAFSRDTLQPCVDKGEELYEAGLGVYSPDTLILLREALDEAIDALSNEYLTMTEPRGQTLCDNIENVELEYFSCHVFLAGQNVNQYVNDSIEHEGFYGFSGDTVRLNAIPARGYKFICWTDSDGNIISDIEEFEYTVSRSTTIVAVTAPESSFKFIYKDMFGKIYKTEAVTDFSQVYYPVAAGNTGLRTGYRVKEWQNNYRGELPDSGEVTQDVTFTAILEKADTRYTVQAFAGDDVTVKLLKAAQVFRVTAPETYNDDDFSYWTDTDTGEIVSYSLNLSVSVYANMSFTAVYGGGVDDVTLVNLWTPNVESGKIGFTAQVLTGLDFASEVMHGVLLLKSDEPVDEILFDTPGVIVGRSSGYSALTNTFIINKKNVRSGETWYGRAFVVYTDDGGSRKTVYSDIKSATMP